ncbi:hypothetical protein EV175_006422 [Coemansia sp. RSA 1933]|nr:hypothetical protein EV175_006422 [Coemansia sp. RSA 1933]
MDNADYSARGLLQSMMQEFNTEQQHAQIVSADEVEARVNSVWISGVSRIRTGVLDTLAHRILMARTVGDVAQEAREVGGKLKALGIARDAHVILGLADSGKELDVGLECVDGKRFRLRTEAGVNDTEGTAGVSGGLINIFGGGESADVHYTRGSKTKTDFQAKLAMPVSADPFRSLSISGSQRMINHRPYKAHDELNRELSLAYSATDPRSEATTDLSYSLSWRNICNLGAAASPTLRTEAGHSLKSSLWHVFAWDTRDSTRIPTHGSLIRLTTELAGLIDALGDARFVKTRAELQTNQDLGGGFVVSTGVQAGLLWNLDPKRPSHLSDRFFLGGTTNVRGFQYQGIGPRDGNDSIGGDIFYAAGISLLTPLPLVSTNVVKGHVWANAGQLALMDRRGLQRRKGELHRFLLSPSAAVGVGLVYNHSVVRAELSLCLPITATPTDRPQTGPQFSLGMTFL